MNRLRNIVGMIAVCATVAFFTGCGEHDTTSGGGTSNAPNSINGKTYQLTDAQGTSTLSFDAAANNYTLTPSGGGAAETGTFQANQSGDIWNVTTTDSTGTTTSQLTLTFNGAGVGTYTFQRPGQALASGNFAESASTTTGTTTSTGTNTGTTTNTGTNTGTTTNTGTNTGTTTDTGTTTSTGTNTGTTTDTGTTTSTGTNTGTTTNTGTNTGTTTSTGTTTGTTSGGTVTPPANLSAINVVTGAGSGVGQGATYTVNLSGGPSGTFTISNGSTGSGTYTYTVDNTNNTAHLVLNYGGDFQGDFDDMTLIFTTPPGGGVNNYTGNQRVGGNPYPFNGTFTY
jgi:hypothetical protein